MTVVLGAFLGTSIPLHADEVIRRFSPLNWVSAVWQLPLVSLIRSGPKVIVIFINGCEIVYYFFTYTHYITDVQPRTIPVSTKDMSKVDRSLWAEMYSTYPQWAPV